MTIQELAAQPGDLCLRLWFSAPATALRTWIPRLRKVRQYQPRHGKPSYNFMQTWHLS